MIQFFEAEDTLHIMTQIHSPSGQHECDKKKLYTNKGYEQVHPDIDCQIA